MAVSSANVAVCSDCDATVSAMETIRHTPVHHHTDRTCHADLYTARHPGGPNPLAAFLANNLSGSARAIPTLAFLIIVIPLLGIGFTPVIVGLTMLGIPPILLNTIAGMRGIDPATIDAGRGMGMTWWELLMRVRVPLVLPLIAAGMRTSAVQIVATAPFAGLDRRRGLRRLYFVRSRPAADRTGAGRGDQCGASSAGTEVGFGSHCNAP